jgi:predicted Zn-dependent protease
MNRYLAFMLIGIGIAALTGCSNPKVQEFMNNDLVKKMDVTQTFKQVKGPTEAEEIEQGTAMTEILLGARPLLNDPELQMYVNRVGMWVAQQSERPGLPWSFGINDSEHVNAFAAPGGYVIITKGMMKALRNESELAGVLGHEVAHVTQQHHIKAMRKGAFANVIEAGLAVATDDKHSELLKTMLGPTKDLYARGLDKSDEFEADRIGLVLAARAGYDPFGLPAALTTLDSIAPNNTYMALLFKTHPAPKARLERITAVVGNNFDTLSGSQLNAERFGHFTERLRVATQ